ncbi:MAG: O-antigen ligase family protein [Polyangiaceae bacterium]
MTKVWRRTHRRLVVTYTLSVAIAVLLFDPLSTASSVKTLSVSVVALALYLAGLLERPKGRQNAHFSYADLAGIAFLGLSALSLAWGRPGGLVDLAGWMGGATLVIALKRLPRTTRFRIFEASAVTIGVVSALVAVVQKATHHEATAGHGNPDWLGLALSLSFPVCLDMARRARRSRVLLATPVVVVAAALYLSHSRVGWVAAGVSVAMMLFMLVRVRRGGSHAFFAAPGIGGHLGAFREADAARAYAGRLWIWEHSARATLEHPFVGAGLGRFGFAYQDAQGVSLSRMPAPDAARRFINATTAHDDYLQIACESGIPAAAAFALFLVRSTVALARQRALGAFGTFVSFAVCALGDSPARQPACIVLLALAYACVADTPVTAKWASEARRLSLAFAILPIATCLFSASHYRNDRLRVRGTLSVGEGSRHLLERAARFDVTGEADFELGLRALAEGLPSLAAHHLSRSSDVFANVGTHVALGNAHAALGDPRAAKEDYERALKRNPGSLKAHMNLAEIDRRLGLLGDARSHAETARRIAPYHPKVLDLVDRLDEDELHSQELERVDIDDDVDGTW